LSLFNPENLLGLEITENQNPNLRALGSYLGTHDALLAHLRVQLLLFVLETELFFKKKKEQK